MVNDTILYGMVTLGAALLGVCVRYAFRSKCSEVNICFGLVNIKRDIEGEIENTELEGVHRQGSDGSTFPNTPTHMNRTNSLNGVQIRV